MASSSVSIIGISFSGSLRLDSIEIGGVDFKASRCIPMGSNLVLLNVLETENGSVGGGGVGVRILSVTMYSNGKIYSFQTQINNLYS